MSIRPDPTHDAGGCAAFRALAWSTAVMAVVAALALATASALAGQTTSASSARTDTLGLVALQEAAVAMDPRLAQRELERRATDLRLRNLVAERLPSLEIVGSAAYQSEVTDIPVNQPNVELGAPPKDRYETSLEASWLLWDGGRLSARGRVEEARRDAALAALDAELHEVRTQVSEAFFGALLAQERLREARTLLDDLDARLAEVRARVAAGTGLPGDTAVVRAELLAARQQVDALEAEHRAALDVLGQLTGRTLTPAEVLVVPVLEARVTAVAVLGGRGAADAGGTRTGAPGDGSGSPLGTRLHPQYDVFDMRRSSMTRQEAALRTDRLPQVSAFGQLAYGSPGYSQFDDELHDYWRARIHLQWRPWDWRKRVREMEVLEVQRRIVDTEEEAFTDRLLRAVHGPLRRMERARAALATDPDIIDLREQVERQSRAQLAERAISPSRYTDARTDLMEARVAHARHRVELAQAQADYLLILGAELR